MSEGLSPTDAAVSMEQLRTWAAHTDLRLRGARAHLERDRYNLAQLSRSDRRSRAGASLVGRIEQNGAIVAQLEVMMAGIRDQLGFESIDDVKLSSWEDLTGCDCERKPSKLPGMVEVVWNPKCKLHGLER